MTHFTRCSDDWLELLSLILIGYWFVPRFGRTQTTLRNFDTNISSDHVWRIFLIYLYIKLYIMTQMNWWIILWTFIKNNKLLIVKLVVNTYIYFNIWTSYINSIFISILLEYKIYPNLKTLNSILQQTKMKSKLPHWEELNDDSSDHMRWSIWANRFFKWFTVLVTKVSAVRACTARGGVQLISPFTDAAWRFNTGNARRTRGSSRALSRAK